MLVFSAPFKPFPALQKCGELFPGRQFTVGDRQIRLEDLCLGVQRGRTFIYYQDTSHAGLIKTWLQEKDLETPKGTYRHIGSLGYYELEDGDAVFSRDLHGDNDPAGDVVQVWVDDGSVLQH
ncbi:hypothetical protein K438DRAFT_1873833 [Mycena galopus ATCC 62051]|nr:hypothetical protein K438DRAFT_1873833 [Mycena galopus ATCC 62051]